MSIGRNWWVPALLFALAGCGSKPPAAPAGSPGADTPPAAAVAPAPVAQSAPDADLAAAIAAADLNRGKVLFLQCRACHGLVPEAAPGKIGPTLYGVVGRPAGAAPGFVYSETVAGSGITWTAEEIDKWLARPSDYLPGNKMVFVGLQNPQDRADVIAYIQQESAKQAAQ